MINEGKSRGQRFCPGQGLSPLPPGSQPVVIAMSYNDPYYVSFPTGLGTEG